MTTANAILVLLTNKPMNVEQILESLQSQGLMLTSVDVHRALHSLRDQGLVQDWRQDESWQEATERARAIFDPNLSVREPREYHLTPQGIAAAHAISTNNDQSGQKE